MGFNVEPGSKRAKLKGLAWQKQTKRSSRMDDGWGLVQFVRPTVFNAMPELDDEEKPEDDGVPLGPGGGGVDKVRHGVYVQTLHRVGECARGSLWQG